MTKTVLTQVFDQLKLQIGEDKFSGLFEPTFWLEREREQIEEAVKDTLSNTSDAWFNESEKQQEAKDYYNSKYGGEDEMP